MARRLLIVRHGPGRGRHAPYLQHVLDSLTPEIDARLVFHDTGSGAMPKLDGLGGVLFWLADPLREAYPDCYAEAAALAAHARDAGVPVYNPPESLSNSIKTRQAVLWRDAGIPTAVHAGFESRDELLEVVQGMDFPLIVRADQLHRQRGAVLCRSVRDVRAISPRRLRFPGTVTPFVDTRAPHRAMDRRSLFGRYYHKKRTIVLGDIVHPRHLIFSRRPIVGLSNSTLSPFRRERLNRWMHRLPAAKACVAADNAFFHAPAEHAELLRRACRVLGFDTAAIDYSTLPDGRAILWEANPYFHVYEPSTYILAEERLFGLRWQRLLEDLKGYFEARTSVDEPEAAHR